jgi:hypothetical protein
MVEVPLYMTTDLQACSTNENLPPLEGEYGKGIVVCGSP